MEFDEEWAKEPPKGEAEEERAEAEAAEPRSGGGGARRAKSVEAIRRVYDEWGRATVAEFDVYDDEMEWGWSDIPGWRRYPTAERNSASSG